MSLNGKSGDANDSLKDMRACLEARWLRLAEKINAGTVWINTWHKYHPNAQFGGYKMSG
jgi:acyl-CoA reductase-like NAD-dependent aldehyde dehydrogenase